MKAQGCNSFCKSLPITKLYSSSSPYLRSFKFLAKITENKFCSTRHWFESFKFAFKQIFIKSAGDKKRERKAVNSIFHNIFRVLSIHSTFMSFINHAEIGFFTLCDDIEFSIIMEICSVEKNIWFFLCCWKLLLTKH